MTGSREKGTAGAAAVLIGEAPLGIEAIVPAGGAPSESTGAGAHRVARRGRSSSRGRLRPQHRPGPHGEQQLTDEELRDYQELTVRMHDGGLGPPLPVPLTPAAMAVRLAGFVRGGAAVHLVAMLNAGISVHGAAGAGRRL